MTPTSVLLLTHKNSATGEILLPHLNWLKFYNPLTHVHVIVGEDSPFGRKYNWKNGDQPLRRWWIDHHREVPGDVIAIIEWDTLVATVWPELPAHLDLAGKRLFIENKALRNRWQRKPMRDPTWHPDNWYWWPEIPLLRLKSTETAIGLISFGCFLARRWVMDAICKCKWDYAYSQSIQNELRFPTAAFNEGARVGEIMLPNVSHKNVTVGLHESVYHGVKKEYNGSFTQGLGNTCTTSTEV
jgi:hypothetical protein